MSESESPKQTAAKQETQEIELNSPDNGAAAHFPHPAFTGKLLSAESSPLKESWAENERTDEDTLEELRLLLLGHYQRQMVQVQEAIDELSVRTADKEGLIRTITPVMGDLIRNKIRENRDEMIEALYPIIGQLVMRAVSEAVRDLARKMDAQLHTTYSVSYQSRRLWARLNGVSESDLILRDSLPFHISEVFLIHRESGLLLWHGSLDQTSELTDADLISSMLTAIRDFTADAFGNNQEERLDEIQYGNHQILIETAQHVYIAVVAAGIEPAGFRSMLRRHVIAIQHSHYRKLADYNGDASQFEEAGRELGSQLMRTGRAAQNSRRLPVLLQFLQGRRRPTNLLDAHHQRGQEKHQVHTDGITRKVRRLPAILQFLQSKRRKGNRGNTRQHKGT
ncbi:MAG: hypothetical protein R3A44_22975 [Caldilineaceae bacterium]